MAPGDAPATSRNGAVNTSVLKAENGFIVSSLTPTFQTDLPTELMRALPEVSLRHVR